MRIAVTSQPFVRKCANNAGVNCRSLADAALLLTSKHQLAPSIGPGWIAGHNDSGISDLIALSRSLESCAKADKRANVGESAAACNSVKERLLWRMVGLIITVMLIFRPFPQIVKSQGCGSQTALVA